MKYNDSIEKSAEYLRQLLPLMSRQDAALHPVSYAVWYEYVSGMNPGLRAAVDAHTANGAVLDEKTTAELFHRYIADLDEESARRVKEGFQKIMADMSQSALQAGQHADKFGGELEKWTVGLSESGSGAAGTVVDLLGQARGMQGSISVLKGRLDASQQEIEQLRQEVTKAREDALVDGLTGLTNRRGFDAALESSLAANDAEEQGPSLLMADIDFFKKVNDNYGHLFGDKVLRAVAQILKDNVKGKDTAARYGGEEFVVLLPDTPLEGARHVAEKIRSSVEKFRIKRTDSNEAVASVTISLGVASYRQGEAPGDFVARADAALYASKEQGRNRVTLAATPLTD